MRVSAFRYGEPPATCADNSAKLNVSPTVHPLSSPQQLDCEPNALAWHICLRMHGSLGSD